MRRLGFALCIFALACSEEEKSVQGNRPPTLDVPGPQIVVEGTLVSFVVGATDLDDDPVTLAVDGLPEGARFTPESGRFDWVPDFRQAGSYNVSVSASDGRFTTSTTVSIAVVDQNRAPTLDGASDFSITEGALVELAVRAADPDGDTVTLEVGQLPRGATFDPPTGAFGWRPGYDQAGQYALTFAATDGGRPAITTRLSARITVENYTEPLIVEDFPVLGFLGDDSVTEGRTAKTTVLLDLSGATDTAPGIVEMKVSNSSTMADASWQPYQPLVAWVLSPGDGDKTVYARFRDVTESVSPRVEGAIDLDSTPPYPVSAVLLGPAVTNASQVTLALWAQDRSGLSAAQAVTASDDPTFASAAVGPAPFPAGAELAFPLAGDDGPRTIFVRFRDTLVNDAVVAVGLVRDLTPPDASSASLAIVSPTGNGYTSSVSVTLLLGAPPDAAQVVLGAAEDSCSDANLAGRTPQPVAGAISFLLPAGDGPKRVCAKLLDAAGNRSAFFFATIVLDTIAPTQPRFAAQPPATNESPITIALGTLATDASSVRYQWIAPDSSAWAAATFPKSAALVANTLNTFRVRAVDAAGNLSPEHFLDVLHDGKAPPTPTILTPRLFVNSTTTSVTLAGSSTDPTFETYQTCTVAIAAGADCGSESCTGFTDQPSSFALSLAANQATCLFARAVDAAGNPSEPELATIVSDLIAPTAPVLDPIFDPGMLTIRTDFVDLFIGEGPSDLPLGGPFSPYRGVAYLEVDSGGGFEPLCAECVFDDTWDPCAPACACTDARLGCMTGRDFLYGSTLQPLLASVRVPVVTGVQNDLAVRAVDLAGNTGQGRNVVVEVEGSSRATAAGGSKTEPRLFGSVLTYLGESGQALVDLGPDRRPTPDDRSCTLGTASLPSAPGSAGVLYVGAGNGTELRLRGRGPDGAYCTTDDDDTLLATTVYPAQFRAIAQSGDRRAWWEGPQGAVELRAYDGATTTLTTVGQGHTLQMGGRYLAGRICDQPCTTFGWIVASAPRGFSAGGADAASVVSAPPSIVSVALAPDGKRLFYLYEGGSGPRMAVCRTGPDERYLTGDDACATRPFPQPSSTALALAIDGSHATAILYYFSSLPNYITDWSAGPDGEFSSDAQSDDTVRQVLPTTVLRRDLTLSGGLLVYAYGNPIVSSDLRMLDLSAMRWEAVAAHDILRPTFNGSGTMVSMDASGVEHLLARTAAGRQTQGLAPHRVSGSSEAEQSYAATGHDLVVASEGATEGEGGIYAYDAGSDRVWFTSDDPQPRRYFAGAWSGYLGVPVAGEGKALFFVREGMKGVFHPFVLEPGGTGSLRSASVVDVLGSCVIWGGPPTGGVSARHAAWIGTDAASDYPQVCVRSAGANGRFEAGSDDVATAYLLQPDGEPYRNIAAARVSGNRIALHNATDEYLKVVDAGANGIFEPTDAVIDVPIGALRVREIAMAGELVGFIAIGDTGAQVFVYDLVTGRLQQQTLHYSPKGHLALEPSGRMVWEDGVTVFRSLFVWIP